MGPIGPKIIMQSVQVLLAKYPLGRRKDVFILRLQRFRASVLGNLICRAWYYVVVIIPWNRVTDEGAGGGVGAGVGDSEAIHSGSSTYAPPMAC